MYRKKVLLLEGFRCDGSHRGPLRGLADRRRVVPIVLVGFNERLYKLRMCQPNLVSEPPESTRPVMGTTPSLESYNRLG
jgi:hypothetical protein